ncbi:propionyl-coenzyme A carboxylase alpha polypeptide [Mesorhizobium sp. B2-3-3]|nr:propionyl-coenzyme A carboxylase alpha polypeptide [Mesorhizobium sp. B2-4-15]TPN32767.1 propionyl-coenzyme A carboxylase alpha polypeptide [Mesorhizobium sp. B2-3-3]
MPGISPTRGEIRCTPAFANVRRLSPIADVEREALATELLISPLVGEMPGRAEGGAKERDLGK